MPPLFADGKLCAQTPVFRSLQVLCRIDVLHLSIDDREPLYTNLALDHLRCAAGKGRVDAEFGDADVCRASLSHPVHAPQRGARVQPFTDVNRLRLATCCPSYQTSTFVVNFVFKRRKVSTAAMS